MVRAVAMVSGLGLFVLLWHIVAKEGGRILSEPKVFIRRVLVLELWRKRVQQIRCLQREWNNFALAFVAE